MRKLIRWAKLFTIVVGALAALLACTGERAGLPSGTAAVAQREVPQLPQLLAPQEALSRLRQASAAILRVDGADFEAGLAHNLLAATGANGLFSPAMTQQRPGALDELAYGIYRLNTEGQAGTKLLRVLSASPNYATNNIWIGLADWSAQRWQWLPLPSATIGPAALDATAYVNTSFDVLVAVVVLGARPYALQALSFNAYDEVEPNDAVAQANLLPAGPLTGFSGSIGTGAGYPGYDGDNMDVFAIPYVSGASFQFVFSFNKATGDLKYTLARQDGTPLVNSDTSSTTGNAHYSFGTLTDVAPADYPLLLTIEPLSGFTDYELSLAIGDPPSAAFSATPRSGAAPLQVQLDASASSDPDGDIAYYSWALRDEDWSVMSPAAQTRASGSPLLNWELNADGMYLLRLTVYDACGFNASAWQVLAVGATGYDEVEDNDAIEQATALDPGKSAGWLGNLGGGNLFASTKYYDGDDLDYAWIDVPLGLSIVVDVENLTSASELGTGLSGFDGTSNNLELLNVFVDQKLQATQLQATEPKVYVLVAGNDANASDYKLSWAIGQAPTLSVTPDVTSGAAPLTVNFTTEALDADGTVERIVWDFVDDDVIQAEGPAPTFIFTEPGRNYFCKAIAFDDDGLRVVTEFTITTSS